MIDNIQDTRIAKLNSLLESEYDPYSLKVYNENIYRNSEAVSLCGEGKEGQIGTVAGKIMLKRDMGNLTFITINRDGETIQIALSKGLLTQPYWDLRNNLDLGDWILATGNLGKTIKGEPTVWANYFEIISKSLTPPPDKVEGLQDQELKYRKRHIDFWSKETRNIIQARSTIIQSIRTMMYENKYMEVETPILQPDFGGANAKPFECHYNALESNFYLRIAPELYLKKMIIGGFDKVFEIGKNFRNEGVSPRHNPEFTVIEAYQTLGNYQTMIELAKLIVNTAAKAINKPELNFRVTTLSDLIVEHGFQNELNVTGYDNEINTSRMMEIYENHIEHKIIEPTFITHFPSENVPLAKRSKNPQFAEMFELVVNGRELGCGYTEQTNPNEQLNAFSKQRKIDTDFIEALKYGMPPTGGLGIGLDRLVSFLLKEENIKDVIAFPTLRKI